MKKAMGTISTKATGVTFQNRQGKLWNVRMHEDNAVVMLRREKNNANDPNAIAVLVKTGNTIAKVGYVSKNYTYFLAKIMDEGKIVRAYPQKDKNGNKKKLVVGEGKNGQYLGLQFKIIYELAVNNQALQPAMA